MSKAERYVAFCLRNVRPRALTHSGHHQAEQAPDEVAATLLDFLAA
jgi:pimeloyl-ACP methyl ester carboxylesterase